MIHTDILIIGAGPAGATCARVLTDGGADVVILDKAVFPRPKTCAGWITPEVLKTLGPLIETYPYGITYFERFHIALRGLKFSRAVQQYAIRRVEFDGWLASQCGAPIDEHHARSIVHDGERYIIDDKYAARILIGAGGTHCPVYYHFFKKTPNRDPPDQIIAIEEEFHYPHNEKECRLWFMQEGLPGYAWYVPKAEGIVNIGVGAKVAKLKESGKTIMDYWKLVIARIEELGLVTGHEYNPVGHSYYLRGRKTIIQRRKAYLIGDSAGLSTVDMGEGISAAIQSGQLAAEAILTGGEYRINTIKRYSLLSILFR